MSDTVRVESSDRHKFEQLFDYFHLSSDHLSELGKSFRFTPRTPRTPFAYNGFTIEDDFTERISFSTSLELAHEAVDQRPRPYIYAAGGVLDNIQGRDVVNLDDRFEACYTDLSHDENEYGYNFDFAFYVYHAGAVDRDEVVDAYRESYTDVPSDDFFEQFLRREADDAERILRDVKNDIVLDLAKMAHKAKRGVLDTEEIMRHVDLENPEWTSEDLDIASRQIHKMAQMYNAEMQRRKEKSLEEGGDDFLRFLRLYLRREKGIEGPSDLPPSERRVWKGCVPDAQQHQEIWVEEPVELHHVGTLFSPHSFQTSEIRVDKDLVEYLKDDAYELIAEIDKQEPPPEKIVGAIISPERAEALDNEARHDKFRNLLDAADLMYKPIQGNYEGSEELSYLIPNISKQNAINLAKKFDQDSLIYAQGGDYQKIASNGEVLATGDSIAWGEEAGDENYSVMDGKKFAIQFDFLEQSQKARQIKKGDELEVDSGQGVYGRAIFKVQETMPEGIYVKPEDFPPFSFHLETATQLNNAEAGDVYRISNDKLVYPGPEALQYKRLSKPPYYALRIGFVSMKDQKKVIVEFTDGRNSKEFDKSNFRYIKDPHLDGFRRTGRNIFNMTKQFPPTLKKMVRHLSLGNDNAYKKIEKVNSGNLFIPWDSVKKYFVELNPEPNPSLSEAKLILNEQEAPSELRYFMRMTREMMDEWDITPEALENIYGPAQFQHVETLFRALHQKAEQFFELISDDGAFRKVFQLPNGRILKLARSPTAIKMNLGEADSMLHTAYPKLFPKVLQRSDMGIWMVMEKVDVIEDAQRMLEYFPKFQELQSILGMTGNSRHFINLMFQIFPKYYKKNQSIGYRGYYGEISKQRESLKDQLATDLGQMADHTLSGSEFNKAWEIVTDPSPLYKNIIHSHLEYGVNIVDVRPDNVGVDGQGNFVIIDAGIM